MTTVQEARNKTIFAIDDQGVYETNLYEFVMESAEKTTSPRGFESKIFVQSETIVEDIPTDDPSYIEGENERREVERFALKQWQGSRATTIDFFNTEEEAEDDRFDRIYKYDFLTDDQRDTMYFESREAAEKELQERKQYQ